MEALLEAVCERSPGGPQPAVRDYADDTGSTDLQTDDSASEEGGVEPFVEPLNKDGTTSPDDVMCHPATEEGADPAATTLPRPCAGARPIPIA